MEPTPIAVPPGLRGVAAHDPVVVDILRGMRESLEARSSLDERTTELVRLGTLVGIGAPGDAIAAHVGRLLALGASPADVWSAALAVVPLTGVPRLVAAGPSIEAALGGSAGHRAPEEPRDAAAAAGPHVKAAPYGVAGHREPEEPDVDDVGVTEWAEVTTLGDLLVRGAVRYGDTDAIVFPDERVTYTQLRDRAVAAARGLRALGVGPGDHVGVLMPNCLDFPAVLFGTALLGGVAVLINARYRGKELAYVVTDADLKVLVTSDLVADHVDHVERLREAFPALGSAAEATALDLADAPVLDAVVLLGAPAAGFVDRAAFEAGAADVPADEVEQLRGRVALRSVGMMMYTSGTTAQPKGCRMTHEMVVRNCMAAGRQRFRMRAGDRFWDPLPMFHMSAILPMVACLDAGAAYLSVTHFEPGAALAMMERERATLAFPTFPPITQALLNHPDYAHTDLSRLRLVVNVAPADTLRKLAEQWPHATQITAYGCTEIGGVACFNDPDETLEQRVNTSGKPFRGIEIRIADPETGATLPPGERGEICARGYSLFEGYHKDPIKTAETIDDDGWFHTGDIGTLDPEGRVSYLGRLKDMLKVGGENVAAAEIEALLQDHPAVSIAQVVAIPDERLVEVPAAFVELRPGAAASEEELLAFCDGRIASFKLPRHVRVVDAWPMSATKIQKFRLREQLVAELGLDGGE